MYKVLYEFIEGNNEEKNSSIINIDSGSDDNDNGDIFKKEFLAILKPKVWKIKNIIFEQSFSLQSNNKTKYLKTFGENGRCMIKFKMLDTENIKKIPSD